VKSHGVRVKVEIPDEDSDRRVLSKSQDCKEVKCSSTSRPFLVGGNSRL
jgi:hypothetical protein